MKRRWDVRSSERRNRWTLPMACVFTARRCRLVSFSDGLLHSHQNQALRKSAGRVAAIVSSPIGPRENLARLCWRHPRVVTDGRHTDSLERPCPLCEGTLAVSRGPPTQAEGLHRRRILEAAHGTGGPPGDPGDERRAVRFQAAKMGARRPDVLAGYSESLPRMGKSAGEWH